MTDPRVFLVDVVAALSAAGDLTMGQPPEHGARSAVLAVAIALESGADVQAAADGFYTTLLRWSGCTANAHETAAMVGDDIAGRAGFDGLAPVDDADGRVAALAAAHCDAAQLLAARLGLGPAVVRALGQVFERWDKRGVPTGLGGDELEPAVRCAVLATETEILSRRYGYATALEIVADRAGGRTTRGWRRCCRPRSRAGAGSWLRAPSRRCCAPVSRCPPAGRCRPTSPRSAGHWPTSST